VAANDRGEFVFDALPPGTYGLWAFAGNLSSRTQCFRWTTISVPAAEGSAPVVLRMKPGKTLRVKVVSQTTGAPIPGARVRLVYTDGDRDHTTDGKGEVELLALTSEVWNVEAAATGYAAAAQNVNLQDALSAAIELRLPPGADVVGRVRDPEGRPVAGVGVSARSRDYQGGQFSHMTTDADGRYQLEHLPLGNLQLYVSKLDYVREALSFRLDMAGEKLTLVDVTLKPRPHGGSVRGVVTDRQGRPIAGAEITNDGRSSNEVRRATTDAKGEYLLDNVYLGSIGHEMVVRAKGFAPRAVEFKPGTATQPAEVNVTLDPGHRIAGRVLDAAGNPVRGVNVYYAGGNYWPAGVGGSGTTDSQGRFGFDSLPDAATFTFVAVGYTEIEGRALRLDGDAVVTVVLTAQGVIRGRVVDAVTGRPVPRFNVGLGISPDRQPGEPVGGLTTDRTDLGETFGASDGRFLLKDLMAGMPHQVCVTADGYRRQIIRRVVADVEARAEAVEVRLTPEDPAKLLTVRGKLVDHRGNGVRGAELRLIAAADRPADRTAYPFNWDMVESGQLAQDALVLQFQKGTTGADGTFEFRGVPDRAQVELVYWGQGAPPGRLDHIEMLTAAERAGLVVKLSAPARVVVTIDHAAFPDMDRIEVGGPSKRYPATRSADGKSFVVEDLPAGRYTLQVFGPPKRVERGGGAFTQAVVAQKPLVLVEGKEERVTVDAADRVGGRQP
jgi:uncharacterized GH25 family protein